MGGCTGWGGVGDPGWRCGLRDRVRDGAAAVHQLLIQWRAAAVLPQVRRRPHNLRVSDRSLLRGQPKPAGGSVFQICLHLPSLIASIYTESAHVAEIEYVAKETLRLSVGLRR